jgi:hypothetical protein
MFSPRSHADRCSCLLFLALACGDDASPKAGADAAITAGEIADQGSSGPGAEATALCIEACDAQIGAGCPGTPETYRPFCERICERTTEQTAEGCFDELLALERCRASLTWECDSFGGAQPTSTCAAESGACLQCMGGTLCDATI